MTTALLIGGGDAGDALALGLADLSIDTARIDAVAGASQPVHLADLDDRRSVAAGVATLCSAVGTFDLVVIALADPLDGEPSGLTDLDGEQWKAACEVPLRRVRIAMQAAHVALRDGGGRIVIVLPTSAMSGEAGSVAHGAVAEGARALGKSAAAAWKDEGISVNFLAVVGAALRDADLLRREVAPLVRLLARCGPMVTASTLVADGGTLMAP